MLILRFLWSRKRIFGVYVGFSSPFLSFDDKSEEKRRGNLRPTPHFPHSSDHLIRRVRENEGKRANSLRLPPNFPHSTVQMNRRVREKGGISLTRLIKWSGEWGKKCEFPSLDCSNDQPSEGKCTIFPHFYHQMKIKVREKGVKMGENALFPSLLKKRGCTEIRGISLTFIFKGVCQNRTFWPFFHLIWW